MSRTQEALKIFDSKFNCAQAVLGAYGPDYGLDKTMAFKLSSVFGTGIARTGGMCGAVTGALMVLSLRFCTGEPKGILQKPVHKKARIFIKKFEQQAGTCNCNAMRGHDPNKGKYVKGNNKPCPGFVELTCKLLEEML